MQLKYQSPFAKRLNNGSYYSRRHKKRVYIFAGVRLVNLDYLFSETLGKWVEPEKAVGWRCDEDCWHHVNSHKAFKRYVKKHSKYLPSGTIMELVALVDDGNVYIKTK